MAYLFRCDRCAEELSGGSWQRYKVTILDHKEDTLVDRDLCASCKATVERVINEVPPEAAPIVLPSVVELDKDDIPF